MIAHLAKYRSLMPSIALICHLCDAKQLDSPVTLEAARRAAAWCEFLESHARRVYFAVTSRIESAARLLGEKIQQGKLSNAFSARDAYRPQWTGLSDSKDVKEALDLLEDIGWIKGDLVTPEGGGRSTMHYQVNPKVRERYELSRRLPDEVPDAGATA
jgi:hypothetical protein